MKSTRRFLLSLLCVAALVAGMVPFASPALAVSANLVISQVYGGGANTGAPYTHDYIEIFNRGSVAASLNGLSLQYASAAGSGNFGATTTQRSELPNVLLQPGQYFLVQEAGGTVGSALPTPDLIDSSPIAMSASAGKVALVTGTASLGCNGGSTPCSAAQLAQIVDLVGYGNANYYEGAGAAPTLSNTTAALRAGQGCTETDNNSSDFASGTPAPRNSSTPAYACPVADTAPTVLSTYPANGATDFPIAADLTVTFSEPVNTGTGWFQLSCSTSGTVAVTVSGGPTDFSLDPDANLVDGETCTLTLYATGVTDQDTNDPPDNMAANVVVGFTALDVCALAYTPIYSIQGSGLSAAITGMVTTQGVVVGDYEVPMTGSGQIRGFFIQDLTGDGDAATSDGIFVYNAYNDSVDLGDVVRVTGTAVEYQDQTQISGPTIVKCGTGSVDPVDVNLPFATADFPERYEGMLVRLPQTLYVTENYQLGRFGEVLLSSGDRLWQPTHLFAPGDPGVAAQLLANSLNQILLDDGNNLENRDPIVFGRNGNPLSASNTLRSGDTATNVVGVLTYSWGGNDASPNAYRVRPINALDGYVNFEATNPRPSSAPDVGGTLRVAGMNLLNFFNTFGNTCTLGLGGAATDCRGASNAAEFARQWPKTVAAIVGTQADIVGVIEMENDGYGPDSAIEFLVDKLNEATAPGTYAFVDADAGTGQVNALGVDAIKVGLLYKPAVVSPVGQSAALNAVAFVNGGDLEARNRPALAQAFEETATGGRFVVSVNHLKSKGSACDDPDAGDGQGNCAIVRENAAAELVAWLASDPTGIGDPDALIIGDLNSYAKEDPITVIQNAGYSNLLYEFGGDTAYSYVFDGMSGYLDHALSTASLTPQVTGVAEWHINTDEPSVLDYNEEFKSAGQRVSLYAPDQFRVSDHDPVIVGLDVCDEIAPTIQVTVSPNHLWPANHKYVTVKATVQAADNFDPNPTVTLVSVTSNEPDNGLGDGDAPNDIVQLGPFTFKLRAERSGTGQGRIYTLTYQVTDACGNSTLASATVTVPHDMAK